MDLLPIPTAMLVLTGIALIVAGACHWHLRGFWRASLASAVVTPLVFFVVSLFQEAGVPSPLSLQAFTLIAGFSLLVAFLVGAGIAITRRLLPTGV